MSDENIPDNVFKYSYSAKDEMWRWNCARENICSKLWETKYDYLINEYNLLEEAILKLRGKSLKKIPSIPIVKRHGVTEPPKTEAGVIGWRFTTKPKLDPFHKLKFGYFFFPKGEICTRLGWPPEAIE